MTHSVTQSVGDEGGHRIEMQGAAKNPRIIYKEVDHEKLHPPKGTLTTLSHKQAFT